MSERAKKIEEAARWHREVERRITRNRPTDDDIKELHAAQRSVDAALALPADARGYDEGFRAGIEVAARFLDEWVARPAGGEGQNALVDAMVRSAEDMVRILAERIRAVKPALPSDARDGEGR